MKPNGSRNSLAEKRKPMKRIACITLLLFVAATANAGIQVSLNGTPIHSADGAKATIDLGSIPTPLAINTQPISQMIHVGSPVTFTVVATGTAPLSYQWKKDNMNVAGANAASLAISSVAISDAGVYVCVVHDSSGSVTSSPATLTVDTSTPDQAPSITTQPVGQTVDAGTGVTFTIVAAGTAPLSYQWNKGGVAISGATSNSYVILSTVVADSGDYTCTVSNLKGSVTSSPATLLVNPVTQPQAPSITTQPISQTAEVGTGVTFTVVATGTAPLSYQWNKGGVAISGATTAGYAIAAVSTTDAGSYTCTVSNTKGSVTSDVATLSVGADVKCLLAFSTADGTPTASIDISNYTDGVTFGINKAQVKTVEVEYYYLTGTAPWTGREAIMEATTTIANTGSVCLMKTRPIVRFGILVTDVAGNIYRTPVTDELWTVTFNGVAVPIVSNAWQFSLPDIASTAKITGNATNGWSLEFNPGTKTPTDLFAPNGGYAVFTDWSKLTRIGIEYANGTVDDVAITTCWPAEVALPHFPSSGTFTVQIVATDDQGHQFFGILE